jgi:hypothetical protein
VVGDADFFDHAVADLQDGGVGAVEGEYQSLPPTSNSGSS